MRGNTIRDNRVGVQIERVAGVALENNTFEDNVLAAVRLVNDTEAQTDGNQFARNRADREAADARLS